MCKRNNEKEGKKSASPVCGTRVRLSKNPGELERAAGPQLVKKGFDKLVDGEASSPARCRASNLRFEPSAVSPRAKPENPKGFQPPCHPHQSPLKIKDFSGAETARKRFFLWKMGFSGAKIAPCPPYTPLGTIESSKGLRPSRALRGFFDSLRAAALSTGQCPAPLADGRQCRLPPAAAGQNAKPAAID